MNLPGLYPNDYRNGDKLEILMSYIESEGIGASFDYYDLGFCQHDEIHPSNRYKTKSFGEALEIEHWVVSPYSGKIELGKN